MYTKEERPILEIVLSKTDKRLDFFSSFFFILLWCISITEFVYLPDIIPIHFDFAGKPDNYGSKFTLFILPFIISLVFILFSYLCKRPHIFNYPSKITNENAVRLYSIATQMLRALKLGITFFCTLILIFVYLTIKHKNINFGVFILPLIFCTILFPTIYYCVKLMRSK
ncbi:MAG: DUF1648 domain-containing protein [Bacteroidetes bacterium]|nr:DUF1648 domain-containing protein [Bacteroidota bacterium]